MNDNNSNNNTNSSGQSSQGSPFLSARGQYNPNLTQQQAHPNTYEQQAQPHFNPQAQAHLYQQHNQPNPLQATEMKLKHSGLGISSFVISMVAVITFILCFVIITFSMINMISNGTIDINTLSNADQVEDMLLSGSSDSMSSTFLIVGIGGLFLILSLVLAFVGLVLGIIGATQKNRKKVFSVLGIVFNSLVLLGFVVSTLMGSL